MAGRSLSRRQFLHRAGGGAGLVAVGLGGAQVLHHEHGTAAHAQEPASADALGHDMGSPAQMTPRGPQLAQRRDPQYFAFFNETQAPTVAAIAERLWPGAPDKPGATEADVVNYIDLALSGAYLDQQDFYRRGLEALDTYTLATTGEPFYRLAPAQQDDVLRALERGEASSFTWPTAQEFFNRLWTHTIEGMFADPVYGGNRDFAGWRLIEFFGAQSRFLPSDMQSDAKFTRAPILGLQQQLEQRLSRSGGE